MRPANDLPAALAPMDRPRSLRPTAFAYASILGLSLVRLAAAASDDSPAPAVEPPARPAILFNRWQEDWSVLANPDVSKEPFDNLKYISLSDRDPQTYLSLGANLRERFESNDATSFGVGTNRTSTS